MAGRAGFERVPAIEIPGEFCMHGGIFDLFPADAEDPVRIELFGKRSSRSAVSTRKHSGSSRI